MQQHLTCNRKRSVNGTDNEHDEIASNENISRFTTLPVPLLYVAKSFGQANLYVTVNADRIFAKHQSCQTNENCQTNGLQCNKK